MERSECKNKKKNREFFSHRAQASEVMGSFENLLLMGGDHGDGLSLITDSFIHLQCIQGQIQDFSKWLSHFLKYPMKMKSFGLTEIKLFHFHRIFKNGGQEGGGGVRVNPLNPLWIRQWYCARHFK